MINFIKKNSTTIIIVILLFVTFIFIDDIINKSILGNTSYNSYELQARAWLNGKTYLDHDYPYLELAIYNGKYFVSFPPFPSVFLLPFIVIFHNDMPTNFISFVIFTFNFILIYKILKRYKNSDLVSILLASSFTIGSCLLTLAVDSGVWFIAQLLNNCLCLLAINAFLNNKKALMYLYLALAVGCRPFSAIYILLFFIYYIITEKDKTIGKRIIDNIILLSPAIIIGIIYMIYNYVRFDNILEFGHNYLPEFVNSEHGQFSLHYLLPNLKSLFFGKIKVDSNLNLSFDMPFSFFIANPIMIVYVYKSIKNIIKTKKISLLRIMIFICLCINIIFLCLHKTLGGWQYGSRYMCDVLPIVLLALITYSGKKNKRIELDKFEIMCIILGIIINIFGVIIYYTDKLF